MASAIATIPVLTDEVAEKFEAQAKKTLDEYQKQTSYIKDKNVRYEQGIHMVKSILEKSGMKGI